jgi:general secretion pathway protein M
MKLALKADRSTIVVGASLGLVALLVLYALFYFLSLRQSFVDEIETIEPRTARLLGMQEHYDELRAGSGSVDSALRDLVVPASRDRANAAASLQRDVRGVMTDAGLTVNGSQVIAPREDEGYDRLGLDITVEGNVDAIEQALLGLEEMRPMVFVESLRIKPTRTGSSRAARSQRPETGDPRRVNARFYLFALRLQQ